ncbi:MAG: hypothetical protein PHW34_09200 [Hespellia sp.]|nr:hypothetical protein [Hespellia sp.]
MQDEMNMKKLYILCGLSSKENEDIRNALNQTAKEYGYETACVSRYRKEGIQQYISEHPEFRILVLQESMQSSYPYTAEELAELMDEHHLNIVISLKKAHRGNSYMKVLYTAGILNALYEEDATAENIIKRILYPRTRKEAREYYKIITAADAMQTLEIVDEERMQGYLSHIVEGVGKEEIRKNYRYVANSLKIIENMYLIDHLPDAVKDVVSAEEIYQQVCSMMEPKKRWTFGKKSVFKKQKSAQEIESKVMSGSPDVGVKETTTMENEAEDRNVVEMIDEDISDLMGFFSASKEQEFSSGEVFHLTGQEETKKIEETTKNPGAKRIKSGNSRRNVLIGAAISGIILFFTLVILFGFFLYSEYRSTEKSEPVVSQHSSVGTEIPEEPDDSKTTQNKTQNKTGQTLKKKEQTEQKDEQNTEEKQKEETVEKKENSQEAQNVPASEPIEQTETAETTVPGQAPDQAVTEPSYGNVTVTEASGISDLPSASPEQPANYQGRIFTGSEVVQIASAEEQKGIRIYLKTRESGEGYFNASEVAGMVDDTCSYLAQGIENGLLSFVQQ